MTALRVIQLALVLAGTAFSVWALVLTTRPPITLTPDGPRGHAIKISTPEKTERRTTVIALSFALFCGQAAAIVGVIWD